MAMLTDASMGPNEAPPEPLREQFAAVLARHGLDRPARDGDCLIIAPRITTALRQLGIAAATIDVIGWIQPHRLGLTGDIPIMLFRHQATVTDGWLLDATAQQFHPDLPARWITLVPDYLRRMAAVTGADPVTLANNAM